jgi:hypothetical protein
VSPLADRPHRFLFDENLAARLVEALADTYPGSSHVGENCSTDDIIGLLKERRSEIEAFMAHQEAGFLALA